MPPLKNLNIIYCTAKIISYLKSCFQLHYNSCKYKCLLIFVYKLNFHKLAFNLQIGFKLRKFIINCAKINAGNGFVFVLFTQIDHAVKQMLACYAVFC